jgi:hypothetical protein
MTSNSRIDLKVSFEEKDEAKSVGARWDKERRTLYAPPDTNLEYLQRWIPNGVAIQSSEPIASADVELQPEKGIALTELLARVRGAIDHALPDAVWVCDFHFFQATFQGIDAPWSIQTALLQALAAHKRRAFDVLVVIRGGGAVTVLAWLNDLDLAKLLCQARIPVSTGIGHERDNTILDEIAHRRFDTPSKVALHIRTSIKDNALAAIQAWERITVLVGGSSTARKRCWRPRPSASRPVYGRSSSESSRTNKRS